MSKEQELGSFQTGVAITEEYFTACRNLKTDTLIPVIASLSEKCDGLITEPGIYGFYLQVVKLK